MRVSKKNNRGKHGGVKVAVKLINQRKNFLENSNLTLDKHIICDTIQSMKDIEKQLKQAIEKSKMSRYKIAKVSGLTESQLSYFVNGHRTLTLPAAAKLAKALGLELRPIDKKER